MAKGKKVDLKRFFADPMVLQIKVFNAPYDEVVHTQKKPDIREIGGIKFIYLIDDFGNTHHFRVDTVMGIHSWKKTNYSRMMSELRTSDETPQATEVKAEDMPKDNVVITKEGKEVKVPSFQSYIDIEEDGIWPSEKPKTQQ